LKKLDNIEDCCDPKSLKYFLVENNIHGDVIDDVVKALQAYFQLIGEVACMTLDIIPNNEIKISYMVNATCNLELILRKS